MNRAHAPSNSSAWPALQGAPAALASLRCRRGVWGKTPGTQLDYRWIASSPGFAEGCDALAGALRIGSEDKPVVTHLWRRLPERYVAVAVAPGRVRDGAGRLSVIEKQVLEWPAVPGTPAALAALRLLPELPWDTPPVAEADAAAAEPVLALAAPADLDVDRHSLAEVVADGRSELLSMVAEQNLLHCYETLLSGCCPALLRVSGPLSPRAMGALLLPLPRAWADRLSIAGGVASDTLAPYDLRRNWDIVIADLDASDFATSRVEPDAAEVAERCLRALRDDEPAHVADLATQGPSRGPHSIVDSRAAMR